MFGSICGLAAVPLHPSALLCGQRACLTQTLMSAHSATCQITRLCVTREARKQANNCLQQSPTAAAVQIRQAGLDRQLAVLCIAGALFALIYVGQLKVLVRGTPGRHTHDVLAVERTNVTKHTQPSRYSSQEDTQHITMQL
jgi:hypothetical protein